MNFLTKLFVWIEKALSWFDFFVTWIQKVRQAYPGLVEIITPLVQDWNDVIGKAKTYDEEMELQSQARETIVKEVKFQTSGSPRAVPEQAIRATIEAVVYVEKVKKGTARSGYYEAKEVRNRAVELLSRRG